MSEDRKSYHDEWSLQAYLDDTLADEDRQRLELHLAQCNECTAKYASLKHLYSEMERLPDEPLAHDISARVIRSLALKEDRKPHLYLVLMAQLAVAIIVLAAIWPRISLELVNRYSLVQLLEPLRNFVDLSAQGMLIVREFLNWIHIQGIATLSMPTIDWPITGLPLALAVVGMILLWLLGNGFLFRHPANGHIQH
ncbi:MAG: zf-HC2 domain-containing protein [Chloroflexota bacterium]|nr:zf-HC2 domain-containing protein [Chloroflexota bacterium]